MAEDFVFDMKKTLEQRGEDVQIVLDMRKMSKPPVMRVVSIFDVSQSFQHQYVSGAVQTVFDQLMGVSLKFDDNGELDCLVFDNRAARAPTASPDDYGSFINQKLLKNSNIPLWGGTNYAPPIALCIEEMFNPEEGRERVITEHKGGLFGIGGKNVTRTVPGDPAVIAASKIPVFAIFITDGDAQDKDYARQVIQQAGNRDIFFHFISIGDRANVDTMYLRGLASLPHAQYDHFDNIKIDDKVLYEKMISEKFVGWARKHESGLSAA